MEAVSQGIKKHLQHSKNPYFNKKEYKTKHSEFLNPVALYKMGQVQESDLETFIGSMGSITKIEAKKNIKDVLKKK